MAAAFVNALPRIKRILAGNASPFYWPGFKNWKSLAVVSSPPLLCKKYGAGPIARRDETVRRVGCPFNLSWATEVDETSRRVRVVRPELPRSLHRVAIGLLVALALL